MDTELNAEHIECLHAFRKYRHYRNAANSMGVQSGKEFRIFFEEALALAANAVEPGLGKHLHLFATKGRCEIIDKYFKAKEDAKLAAWIEKKRLKKLMDDPMF
jgi:hypothetical protein